MAECQEQIDKPKPEHVIAALIHFWGQANRYFFIFLGDMLCRLIYFTYLCNAKQKGAIAQLVEQRTENPCVPGSIPGGTT